MTPRRWIGIGSFAGLLFVYAIFFTEWFRPSPIDIVAQIRFSVQPPRFGRAAVKRTQVADSNAPTGVKLVKIVETNQPVVQHQIDRIGRPENGGIDQAPDGVANVTFSLDDWYQLTRIRVEDVPADGTAPKVLWHVVGKSRPMNSLLYRRVPEGMRTILPGMDAEPLVAGVPYRLVVEAGRRRGTNFFKTLPAEPGE